MTRTTLLPIVAVAALFGTAGPASATGEIRVAGGSGTLRLETHEVSVEILDQIAVTRVVQTFRNTTGGPVEGIYLFPLPRGAQMTRFAATVDGVLREGRMVEKRAAREAYERARAAGREAALAESREEDVFSVNLARIPDGSSPRVELAYLQLLAYDAGGIAYEYPLLPRGSAPASAGRFAFTATISSVVPLSAAYSDSHPLRIERTTHGATARLEATDFRPSSDLHLAFRVRREETGVDVRLHRVPGEAGYALIAITPRAEIRPEDVIARDVTFVVDVSGSMRGVKIEQARAALRSFVRSLRPSDRFNVVRFSAGATRLWGGLRAADAGAVEAAVLLADGLQAGGGTNIGAALEAALADGESGSGGRPHLIVFLTDGQPTAGETRADAIVDACVRGLRSETRIFAFGIGHDLNHRLLRQVARKSRGAAAFVEREHELELALGNFERRISSPVLSDLRLSASGATLSRVHPSDTTFLFAGDQLLVCAQFEGEGEGEIRLTARDRGAERVFRCPVRFPAEDRGAPLVGTLWGLKKMESLLEEIALRGEEAELRQEVVDLSLRHGIASPYTSFLVLSPDLAAAPADRREESERLLRHEAKPTAAADPAMGGTRGATGAAGPAAPAPPAAPAGPSAGGRWRSADKSRADAKDAPAAESSPAKPREASAAAAALVRLEAGESPAEPSLRAALDRLTADSLRAGDARELLLAALARVLAWKVAADPRDRDAARALLEALAARTAEVTGDSGLARLVRAAGEAGLAVPETLRVALPGGARSR